MLVAIIFIIPSMYFIVLPGVITYINDFYYFLSLLFNSANASIFSNDYSNFKFDIDTTTNTDGEDLLSYLNDFTEISLQERSYFFDWILANPFEFVLYSSSLYLFNRFILKKKIKAPSNLFKNKFKK